MTGGVTSAWIAELGIITVRDLAEERRPPYPSEFLASFVVFGALGLVATRAPAAASLVGWGLVIATLISGEVDVLKPIGTFLSGGNAAPSAKPKNPNDLPVDPRRQGPQ